MPKKCLQISSKDNIATAVCDLEEGEEIDCEKNLVLIGEKIKKGHKFALQEIGQGDIILKNNFPVGRATGLIRKGQSVHIHNVESLYLNNDFDHFEE